MSLIVLRTAYPLLLYLALTTEIPNEPNTLTGKKLYIIYDDAILRASALVLLKELGLT
jgi:hypothetical protein